MAKSNKKHPKVQEFLYIEVMDDGSTYGPTVEDIMNNCGGEKAVIARYRLEAVGKVSKQVKWEEIK